MEDKYYYTKNLFQFVLAMMVNVFAVIVLFDTGADPSLFIAHLVISIGVGIVFWTQGYVGAGVGLIFFYPVALLIGFGLCLSLMPMMFHA